MGLFDKKELETGDMDFLYGKGSFSLQRNSTPDASTISNQMNNLNLYGGGGSNAFPRSKDQSDRSASPNWGSSWGQSTGESSSGADLWNRSSTIGNNLNKGGGFPQGFGIGSSAAGLSTGLSNMTASSRPTINTNNSLLQFSRSMSSPSFSNAPGSTSQPSDFTQNYNKLLSGQSSPRGGLLSLSQQQSQSQLQNSQQTQQQRGVIGQLPSLSMQGHSSPSGSPGLNITSKLTPPQNQSQLQQQSPLPKSSSALSLSASSLLPNSSTSISNSLTGQGLNAVGQIQRSFSTNSLGQQSLLNSMIPSALASNGLDITSSAFGSATIPAPIGTAFDADFPALANRVGSSQSSRTGQNSFSFVMSGGSKTIDVNQEFQIQNEDFPALPGAPPQQLSNHESGVNTHGLGGLMPHSQHHQQQQPQFVQDSSKENMLDGFPIGSYEQILKDGRLPSDKKLKNPVSGIQTNSSGVLTNIPSGMVTDQFGMIGLLTFIRAAETEPNLVTLALGSDLTTLGLNLNSTESLYHTFGSPFSDSTCKPHEIDFYAPQEYLISSYIRDKLAPIKLGRYGEDLLFYLYYTNCGDILQLAAAAELYARDWRYHKDERVWITRFPGMEPQIKTNTYERGTYYYFDPQGWRKVPKEFHVEYDRLEEKPTAQALQQQQQQQAQHQQQQVQAAQQQVQAVQQQ